MRCGVSSRVLLLTPPARARSARCRRSCWTVVVSDMAVLLFECSCAQPIAGDGVAVHHSVYVGRVEGREAFAGGLDDLLVAGCDLAHGPVRSEQDPASPEGTDDVVDVGA